MAIRFNKKMFAAIVTGLLLMLMWPFFDMMHLDYTEEKEADTETATSTKYRAHTATTNTIILFRGVPETHPKSEFAEKGIAVPFGGHDDPIKHRDGNTKSVYTSWTTNVKIAFEYATTDQYGKPCSGDVLVREFEFSADILTMVEDCGEGDIYHEKEYLTTGNVEGCVVIPVTAKGNWKEIERRLYDGEFGG